MRVLIINDSLVSQGGAENYVRTVASALAEVGDTVSVLYGSGGIQPMGSVQYECVPELLDLPGHHWTNRSGVFDGWLSRFDPEIVHFNNLDSASVIQWFGRRLPSIQFVHVQSRYVCPGEGKYYKRQRVACRRPFGPYCLIAPYLHDCGTHRPMRILANYRTVSCWLDASRQLGRLVTASNYMGSELRAAGIPGDKIVVNPIGIQATAPNGDRISEDRPLLIFCGRLFDYKGADHLLRSLEWVATACAVEIIGDGPRRPLLERLAHQCAAGHEVRFTGWIDQAELEGHLRRATVLVLPSLWPEPFGLTGLEAMRWGVPVVAYDVGGVREWLRDGVNGFLVRPGDYRQLAETIERVLADPDLRAGLRAGARTTASHELSLASHLERLKAIYRQVQSEFSMRARDSMPE